LYTVLVDSGPIVIAGGLAPGKSTI
jgi:hypothetical protein